MEKQGWRSWVVGWRSRMLGWKSSDRVEDMLG